MLVTGLVGLLRPSGELAIALALITLVFIALVSLALKLGRLSIHLCTYVSAFNRPLSSQLLCILATLGRTGWQGLHHRERW